MPVRLFTKKTVVDNMKRDFIFLSLILASIISIFYIFQQNQIAKESITYFPIDPTVSFPKAETFIALEKQKDDHYNIQWETNSSLNKRAYLRQNIGFLYANGRLISTMGDWKQNTLELTERKKVVEKESRLFQAISFHYAEIHDANDRIFSSQKITDNFLYVINSRFDHKATAFKTPQSTKEYEWKKVLDSETKNYTTYYVNENIKKNNLSLKHYPIQIPLTELSNYQDVPFRGFTKEKTAQIIGQLTEGLYKNYFLGIRKEDGAIVDPIGSSMPFILINKDHLLVLFTTQDGESILLRQQIPSQ
ncbi:hypothetical protein [Niallia sp. 03133]|uniref:hypothetical protein n=1 Tax=Niallia sp. 03133 TaxID=3458060 RepID=UPI004044B5BB